jgi:hypothetical protein
MMDFCEFSRDAEKRIGKGCRDIPAVSSREQACMGQGVTSA